MLYDMYVLHLMIDYIYIQHTFLKYTSAIDCIQPTFPDYRGAFERGLSALLVLVGARAYLYHLDRFHCKASATLLLVTVSFFSGGVYVDFKRAISVL